MSYKTKPKHFTAFKKYCEEYQEKLGLTGWKITFVHALSPMDNRGCRACIGASVPDKIATIGLNKEWDSEVTEVRLKATAKHEVLHLMMWTLLDYTSNLRTPSEILITEEHDLIRKLEGLIK